MLKKCPNCGASIEHKYDHYCKYCRTFLHVTDEEIKKINNVDFKISELEIEPSPIRHTLILTFRGWSVPKFLYYEESEKDIRGYVVSGSEVNKRIAFRVEIEQDIFYKNFYDQNFRELFNIIISMIPPEIRIRNEYKIQELLFQELNRHKLHF